MRLYSFGYSLEKYEFPHLDPWSPVNIINTYDDVYKKKLLKRIDYVIGYRLSIIGS